VTHIPVLTPDSFEILVVRELRKAGFDVGAVRIHRRAELPEPEQGFLAELVIPLSWSGSTWRSLVVCRRQSGPLGRDVIESAKARLPEAGADVAFVFATADFTPEAIAAAPEGGVALFRVVDGRSVFEVQSAESPGHYPAWLPTYVAQFVDRDAAGQPRVRLLEPGRADTILECMARRY